jgi:single-stranded-DNA-specific exonuclease
MAAGFTVRREQLAALKECLEDYASRRLDRQAFSRPIKVEAVATLADLKPSLHQEIQLLAPFGVGNREPLLVSRDLHVLRAETFGVAGRHLRLQLRDRTATAEAFAFDKGGSAPHLPAGRRIDVVFGLDCDRWDGLDRVRLHLKDLRPATPAGVAVNSEIALPEPTPVLR